MKNNHTMRFIWLLVATLVLLGSIGCWSDNQRTEPKEASLLDIPTVELHCTIKLERQQFSIDESIPVTFTVENTSDLRALPHLYLKTGEQRYSGGESIRLDPHSKEDHTIIIAPNHFSEPDEKSISIVAWSASLTSSFPIEEFLVVCEPVDIRIVNGR